MANLNLTVEQVTLKLKNKELLYQEKVEKVKFSKILMK